MSFDALSRISRAVILLPRAWPGSDTLNMLVMNSETRFDVSASRFARSRSAAQPAQVDPAGVAGGRLPDPKGNHTVSSDPSPAPSSLSSPVRRADAVPATGVPP